MTTLRNVLITGAAARLGRAIAEELHRDHRVVIHYRNSADAAKALANELNQLRPNSAIALHSELNSAEKLITYLVCKDLMKFYKYDHNNINLFQALPLLLIYAILLIFQLPIIVVFSFNNVRDLIRNIAS